jgi:hypothetical protein
MKTASSRHRLEQALARIADPSGEGAGARVTARTGNQPAPQVEQTQTNQPFAGFRLHDRFSG